MLAIAIFVLLNAFSFVCCYIYVVVDDAGEDGAPYLLLAIGAIIMAFIIPGGAGGMVYDWFFGKLPTMKLDEQMLVARIFTAATLFVYTAAMPFIVSTCFFAYRLKKAKTNARHDISRRDNHGQTASSMLRSLSFVLGPGELKKNDEL